MGEKLEEAKPYVGHCGVLKDSPWLSSESIPSDKDTLVRIRDVVRRREVKFKDETKKGYGSLRFHGVDKELGLNTTLLRTLAVLFGTNTGAWKDQYILLYVDPEVSCFGKKVAAVRIRNRKPPPPAGAPALNITPPPEHANGDDDRDPAGPA